MNNVCLWVAVLYLAGRHWYTTRALSTDYRRLRATVAAHDTELDALHERQEWQETKGNILPMRKAGQRA